MTKLFTCALFCIGQMYGQFIAFCVNTPTDITLTSQRTNLNNLATKVNSRDPLLYQYVSVKLLHSSWNMDIKQNFSPFFRVRNILRVLRLLFGLPLAPDSCEFITFTFKARLEYLKLAILMLSICIVWTVPPLLFWSPRQNNNTVNYEDFVNAHRVYGLSEFDFALVVFPSFVNEVSIICYFVSFKNGCRNISDICESLNKLRNDIVMLDATRKKKSDNSNFLDDGACKMLILSHSQVLSFLGGSIVLIATHTILFSGQHSFFDGILQDFKYAILVVNGITLSLLGYPLICCTAEFITVYLLNDVAKDFKVWIVAADVSLCKQMSNYETDDKAIQCMLETEPW